MGKTGLTSDEVKSLAVIRAEEIIRNQGFDKFRITDLAKTMNISHAAIYKHFPDKESVLDEVSKKWLKKIDDELTLVFEKSVSSEKKIHQWFRTLHVNKKQKVSLDPELYRVFDMSIERKKDYVDSHMKLMDSQLTIMLSELYQDKKLTKTKISFVTKTFFESTSPYHHPKIVSENLDDKSEVRLEKLIDFLIKGFKEYSA